VRVGEKIKFHKKTEIRGGKIWEGGREKIKLQRKIEIKVDKRVLKGQAKKVNLGWHMDRKDNHICAPSIHIGALVGVGSLWLEGSLLALPTRVNRPP